MLRLSNIRIGTKLIVMSGLGVLLVAVMIGTQMLGNAAVRGSSENAIRQAGLVQAASDAKASLRGLHNSAVDPSNLPTFFCEEPKNLIPYMVQCIIRN